MVEDHFFLIMLSGSAGCAEHLQWLGGLCSHDIHMIIECMNTHMIFNVDMMDMHMIERSVKLRMDMNVDMSIIDSECG